MKLIFLSLLIISLTSFSQNKSSITPDVFDKWPSILSVKISSDGCRIVYWINEPAENKTSVYLYTVATNRHEKLDSLPREFMEESRILKSPIVIAQKKMEDKKLEEKAVDVWSYLDSRLQSQQLMKTVESLEEHPFSITDNYALIVSSNGADNEWNWNTSSLKTVYLFSIKDGSRKVLTTRVGGSFQNIYGSYLILPEEKFVVYYDAEKQSYFSYEIVTGIKRNISSSVKTTWTTYVKRDVPMACYMPIGFAGTIENDEAVLVYDQYDIFQLDPSGKKNVINLTNGYGLSHNIELRFALDNKKVFKSNEAVILSGFNRANKNDGFYELKLAKRNTPKKLISGPYMYKGTWEDDTYGPPISPIKAKNADVYVVRRMSANESPNYFWTTDFKKLNRITEIQPEKSYNWLTTELVTWKVNDSLNSQGILYKPENFDSTKKYPLIFYYYENLTEGFHGFPRPEVTHGTLNIPYYVSNGYLVFAPDMHYVVGHKGQSALNTIVTAADYLSHLPYVDSRHMGLQGHSRGGWETNFVVTHTNIFAAAMSSSGFCDYVSMYNRISTPRFGANSRQSGYETGYQRVGATLWEKPDLFIENSPVFQANKVSTPLLMMNNKEDNDIPFEQGIEFFTALRRLGKRAWMLQYDGQGHLILNDEQGLDLEIRMKQFFDHYLKDSACPRWMLYGVPASEKGNPDALKLVYEKDPKTGKWLTPKEGGLLTDEEKKKVEALKHRRPVTVTIE